MPEDSDLINEYAQQHTTPEDDIIRNLNRETHLKTIYPRMLSGHLQGKFLEMTSKMIRPSRILEIGTFTGYSAICLARGLANEGLLHTIDINDELTEMAVKYFTLAGMLDKIVIHTGDARKIIPAINEIFDLVFIDGDKSQYVQYYELAMKKLKTGGFILADNVLWNGKVLPGYAGNDKETNGIRSFNDCVAGDNRIERLLLPFHDGIFILRKLQD